ncbi:MAG: MFS transporter [Acidimicrobiales bacterium]
MPAPVDSPPGGAAPANRVAPWVIFSITVTGILANTLITPAIPDILAEFDQPGGRAGILVAAGAVPGIVMAPLIGVLADRHGRRRVLLPALVTFGVFGAASSLAPSFWVLVALRALQGLGAAGLLNLAITLVSDHWQGLDRARLLGTNGAVLTVSIAVFPPVGGLLTELGGWRIAFLPYAFALVTALVLRRQLPAAEIVDRPALAEGAAPAGAWADFRVALRIARAPAVLVPIGMAFVAFVLIFGLFLTALPVHLEEVFDLGAGARGLVLGVPAITSTVVALSLGRLRARFGARRIVLVAWTMAALGFAAVAGAPAVVLVLVGAGLYGLGEGALIPTLQDLVAGAAPAEGRAAVIALLVGAIRAGQSIGPLLVGILLSATTTATPFAVGAALALTVVALAVSAGRRVLPTVSQPAATA